MTAEQKNTPLHLASEDGDMDRVQTLLAAGADPNAKGENEESPLFHAVYEGHTEVTRMLLASGADPNAESQFIYGPLHQAAYRRGSTEIMQMLLEAGADPNVAAQFEHTMPLHIASRADKEMVRILLAAGADPKVRDANGFSPIDYVIGQFRGQFRPVDSLGVMPLAEVTEIVQMLLDTGALDTGASLKAKIWLRENSST